jgi:hypothetical protein
MSGPREQEILRQAGWWYLGYHVLAAALAAIVFYLGFFMDAVAGSWRDALIQLAFAVLLYPPIIPSVMVCGGPGNPCEDALANGLRITVLVLTIAWAFTGVRVLILSVRASRKSRPSHTTDLEPPDPAT